MCFGDLLNDMMLDQDLHCKKTCSLKEFQVTQSNSPTHQVGRTEGYINLELPKATREYRSKTLVKTVKTEKYIISGLQLLGNVGGILGIFVGFSFLGITGPILSVSQKLWKRALELLRSKSYQVLTFINQWSHWSKHIFHTFTLLLKLFLYLR